VGRAWIAGRPVQAERRSLRLMVPSQGWLALLGRNPDVTHMPIAPPCTTPVSPVRHYRRPASRLLRWTLRAILGLVVLLVAVPGVGFAYQTTATELDKRTYPPAGELVDVGGYRLHINCVGTGSPTVVLESAFPGTSADWGWVQPNVAAVSRVCTYDRAGMGWSDAAFEPRDAQRIAADLHVLLQHADIPGPYLLVGHSFGGLLVRQYAAQYPTEVVGMVLIDAMHPDQYNRFPPELALPDASQFDVLLPLVSVGLSRVFTPFPTEPSLPTPQRQQIAAMNASTRSMTAIAHEYQAFSAILAQVAAAGDLGATPLLVLTAENSFPQSAQGNRVWQALQDELAGLSSNSSHQHVVGATHESLVYREHDAQTTSIAILQAIAAVRTGLLLAP